MANRKVEELPGLLISILPILLPLVLIAGGTTFKLTLEGMESAPEWMTIINPMIQLLGNKDIALSIAAVFSIILLAKRPSSTKESLSKTIQDAIADAGVIVLITCAGAVSYTHLTLPTILRV